MLWCREQIHLGNSEVLVAIDWLYVPVVFAVAVAVADRVDVDVDRVVVAVAVVLPWSTVADC